MRDKIIQIGPIPYQYVEETGLRDRDEDPDYFVSGELNQIEQTITLDADMPLMHILSSTWEEMIRAMLRQAGHDLAEDFEDSIATTLSHSITDALERNEHMRSLIDFEAWRGRAMD